MTTERVGEVKVLLEPGGLAVPAGSRVAYLYEGQAERTRFASFIASGLSEDNKCVIISDEPGCQLFSEALVALGVDLGAYERDGALVFIRDAPPLGEGESNTPAALENLKANPRSLRLINDTSWMAARGWRDRDFLRFESKAHLVAENYHSTIICQYDADADRRWRLNQILTSHHFTVVSPRVERNPDRRPRGQIIFDSMSEHLRALTRLQDLSLNLTASVELERVLDSILEAAVVICHCDQAAISCLDELGEMRIRRHRGLSEEYLTNRRISSHDPFVVQLISAREPAIIENIDDLSGLSPNYEAWSKEGIRSIVSLPLVSEGKVFGMIAAGSNTLRRYTQTEVDAMAILAAQAGAAIINARLFEQLREANRAKDEFLAILSHELRTPLTPILGWMHLLKKFAESDQLLGQGLETVDRNAKQLAGLIDDLLDLSRAVSGKIELLREPTDLTALVKLEIDQVSPIAIGRRIELATDLPEGPLTADVDPVRIQQVVGNLLNNAVKFTPDEGRVTVSLSDHPSGAIILEVADTGIGIDPKFLPHVFERFTQEHSGMNRGYGGLGLGLAITRAMVEQHGGQVTAHSAGVGLGSCFRVRLPGAGEISTAPGEGIDFTADADPIRSLGLRVIVVEDSRDTLDMLQLWLTTSGCRVKVAARSSDALKLALEEPPDVIISDIGLPEVDGYELIRMLRGTPSLEHVPAIALTGYAQEQDRQQALAAGYDAHLAKPAEMRRLLHLMQALVRKRRAARD
jgi:signal transduction histidine kinase/ActR/RegA family two-component response regulator